MRLRAALAVVLLVSCAASAVERRALLVALAAYPDGDRLPGVNEMTAALSRQLVAEGFRPEDILVLRDEAATKAGFRAALRRWLVEPLGPGDVGLLWFAGHGGRTPDTNGDEDDGYDEVLCLWDVDDDPLIDDELSELLGRVRAGAFGVLLDCCNSGTGTRGLGAGDDEEEIRALYKPLKGAAYGQVEAYSGSGLGAAEFDYMLLTAARADQSAAAVRRGNEAFLVFTRAVVETLAAAGEPLSWRALAAGARQRIATWEYVPLGQVEPQEPQLEGPDPDRLFLVPLDPAAPPRPPLVEPVGEQLLVPLHGLPGVAAGAVLGLYPPDRPDRSGEPLAEVEVTALTGGRAVGRLLVGQPAERMWPRLRAAPLRLPPLRVFVNGLQPGPDDVLAGQFAARLRELPGVSLVPEPVVFDLWVIAEQRPTGARGYLLDRAGQEFERCEATSSEATLAALRQALLLESLLHRSDALLNPAPTAAVTLKTALEGGQMLVEATAPEGWALIVYGIDEQGRLCLFYPSRAFGAEADRVRFVDLAPPGWLALQAIACRRRPDLPELAPGEAPVRYLAGEAGLDFLARLAASLGVRRGDGPPVVPCADWAVAATMVEPRG